MKKNILNILMIAFSCLFLPQNSNAQTILINPATDGGFENSFGTFTVVNGALGNKWFTGTAAGSSVGTKAAFVGSDASTYTDGVAQTVSVVDFMYKDIVFPAGEANITLTFDYKQPTLDGNFDLLRVFLVPTSTTITAGTELTTGQISTNAQGQGGVATFTARTITILGTNAGTTQRLVFQWKNDAATPHGAGAIDNISLTSAVSNRYSVASGNWGATSTWSTTSGGAAGAAAPVAGDNVFIERNFTVTVNGAQACATVTITGSSTADGTSELIIGNATARTLTLTGALNVTGGNTDARFAKLTFSSTVAGNTIAGATNVSINGNGGTGRAVIDGGTLASELQISGSFTNTAGTFTAGGGTVNFNGTGAQTIPAFNYFNLTSSSTGARTLASSGNIGVAGALTRGTNSYITTGSTVDYNGSAAQTIIAFPYNNLNVTKPAGIVASTDNVASDVHVNGNCTVNSGVLQVGNGALAAGQLAEYTFTGTPATSVLEIKDGATLRLIGTQTNSASFPTSWQTITLNPNSNCDYASSLSQTIVARQYGNLLTSTTGTQRTLASSGIIKIAGTLASGTNVFTVTGSTVEFNGAAAQGLTGVLGNTIGFNNLTINNTGLSATHGLNLSGNVTVGGVLSMAAGQLILNANTLIITNPATTAVTRASGVLISENSANASKMQWNIGTTTGAHVFPFGKDVNTYIPFTLNLTSGDASNITVSTYPTAANNTPLPTTPQTVTSIASQGATDAANAVIDRFWQIDASTTAARAATLIFNYAASETPNPFTTPAARRWNGTAWDAALTGQTTPAANSVRVPNVTVFSPWAVYDAARALPVTLTKFTATPVNNKFVKLSWTTENEINISNYTIEKAIAGSSDFAPVGTVIAQRNTTTNTYGFEDTNVKENVTYQYRLRILENNRSTYSEIRLAGIKGKNFSVKIAPNPSTGNFKINVEGYKGMADLTVYNQQGQVVISRRENLDYGVPVSVDLRNFSKGIYTLKMMINEQQVATKLIVE